MADASSASKKDDDSIPKGYKRRKQLPHVSHLLTYGAPETEGKPKSWMDVFGPPILIVIVFVLSFHVFAYVIENHTHRLPRKLPRMPRKMTAKAQQKATGNMPNRDSDLWMVCSDDIAMH